MLTLVATYIIAISVGAGCAVINDLFFILSMKHQVLKKYEAHILRQLNSIQVGLVIWVILAEIAMFAYQIETESIQAILGITFAKFFIEIAILFAILLIRQVYLPALVRHQHTYGHLSDSMLEHSNGLIIASVTSLTSWLFIIFIVSSEFKAEFLDFGFATTIILYAVILIISNSFFLYMKTNVLHNKHKLKRSRKN